MSSNHTQGPWSFDGEYVESLDLDVPLSVATLADCGDQKKANGYLISAAPELLAALKDVCRFESVIEGMNPSVWPVIHAAIAKAEGRVE